MDSGNFEQQPIETDLKAIAAEVNRAQEARSENRMEGVEAVKNAIRAFPSLSTTEKPPAVSTVVNLSQSDNSPLPAYAQNAAPEVKREIEYLISMAFQQGVGKALAQAEKSPYFVQDAFHDALAGRLYPELQQRGLIK